MKKLLLALAILIVVIFAAGFLFLPSFEAKLKQEMVRAIEERFDGKADVQSLELSFFPQFRVNGKKLILRYKNRTDVPPMISIAEFSAKSGWIEVFRVPAKINDVTLKGLVIQIPPRNKRQNSDEKSDLKTRPDPPKSGNDSAASKKPNAKIPPFVIGTVHADGTVLRILPKSADKDPLEFDLYKLTLRTVSMNHPMKYVAVLKNAKPPGLIDTQGEFGPWNTSVPGQTNVSGKYTFQKADLGVFKGISGILSSVGQFHGMLERIEANGTTDTPDFMVRSGKQPVHLKTEFHAIIDGTNGDTLLQPVNATLGSTTFVCKGGVFKKEGQKGKSVVLDVDMDQGRMEDLLRLAVPGKPMLVGNIQFQTKFDLPPGDIDVVEKLYLNGNFVLKNAEFTSPKVQDKIDELSMRSRGIHGEEADERIVSNLQGAFILRSGRITLSTLSFEIPGATVSLEGTYGLVDEVIDFTGTVRMKATVSQTQTGFKSILLKMVDPFFKKQGAGAVIPIKITGTVKEPKFGLNLGGSKEK